MTAKGKTNTDKDAQASAPEQATESAAQAAAPAQEPAAPPDAASGGGAKAKPAAKAEAPALESLAALADRHRVPAWQEAALCRFMGWAEGKMVSSAEYLAALGKLNSRRLGGGRMG